MNSNIFLKLFGLNPDDFEFTYDGPIDCDDGYIVDLTQLIKTSQRVCPRCGSSKCYSQGKYFSNYIDFAPDGKNYYFNITRKRLKCEACGKTFTPTLKGILPYTMLTKNLEDKLIADLRTKKTFSEIAEKYHLTISYVIKFFDETFPIIPGGSMPEILCIDEFYFSRKAEFKYCCCLVDFRKKELIDIIESRQKPYLEMYFDKVSFKERNEVKYFVSDMYDGYEYIRHKYFPNSIHVVDLFHVISLLTTAINSLRLHVVKQREKNEYLDKFMKTHWDCFLCKFEKIPDKYYSPQSDDGVVYHYSDLVSECIKLDQDLWEGWIILQDLLHYKWYGSFEDSLRYIIHTSERLKDTGNDILKKVGQSYYKWRVEIANGFTKNQYHVHISNGIAESINNNIKTIIKSAYGYRNFNRFRKRCMLIYYYTK